MGNIYILCQNYPSATDKYAMAFVHPRVKRYLEFGLDVKVISFACSADYIYDGVQVYTDSTGFELLRQTKKNILISHAPNIKNHIVFILKAWKYIFRLVFFFHGHEILSTKKYYPEPYTFNKAAHKEYKQLKIYDYVKLPVMRCFLLWLLKSDKCDIVFVSKWMQEAASKSLGLDFDSFSNIHIINNSISSSIKEAGYSLQKYKADFITIRPLNQSKYAIDIVVQFAIHHSDCKFHIYGGGRYFDYYEKPNNITLINNFLSPQEIPNVLNSYKYALMPTRLDAQGVMMCEMATYGIPTIVSSIDVCHEMLDTFDNVLFLDNKNFNCLLQDLPIPSSIPNYTFSIKKTIDREIKLLQAYML